MSLERAAAGSDSVHDERMKTIMKLEDLKTIDQLDDFLSGNVGEFRESSMIE